MKKGCRHLGSSKQEIRRATADLDLASENIMAALEIVGGFPEGSPERVGAERYLQVRSLEKDLLHRRASSQELGLLTQWLIEFYEAARTVGRELDPKWPFVQGERQRG